MADWFKVYETDLDDPRLQWAMGTNPNCGIVFFFLLCRCCHFKSSTIPWNKDLDFLTMASTLKISGPNANDALRMLEHIEFITITKDSLEVANWDIRQSDYMNRKRYYKERYEKNKEFHCEKREKCEFTQRRGEEIRLKEKNQTRKVGNGKPLSGERTFVATGEMPQEYQ